MNSFYGGKQGRTYHIVLRYDSVQDMVTAFSGGGSYTDVNYGLYVIIDTILNLNQKSNPENGLLYRRDFDYNDPFVEKPSYENREAWINWITHPGAGAHYVGQITGPQGETPEVIPITWESLKSSAATQHIIIPASTTMGNDDTLITDDYGNQIWNGDAIKAGSVTIKDNDGNVTGAQVAFDIPNLVLEAAVTNSNPYLAAATVSQDLASTAHPFYYKWNFEIPSGKKGQSILQLVKETGLQIGEGEDSEGQEINNDDEYITYSIADYETNPATTTSHLGRWPYRIIKNITARDGQSEIRTIYDWNTRYQNQLWPQVGEIIPVTLSPTAVVGLAQIPVVIGEGDTAQGIYYCCIESGPTGANYSDLSPSDTTGTYTLGYITKSLQSVWRVISLPLVIASRYLDIIYTYGNQDTISIRNLDYITIDGEGNVYACYSDMKDSQGNPILTYLTSLNDILLIKYINQDDITKEQKITVKYKGQDPIDVSDNFNYVIGVQKYGHHIIFLFSDPLVRLNIPEDKKIFIPTWTDPVTNKTYENLIWYDSGLIDLQYPIAGNYRYAEIKGDSEYVDARVGGNIIDLSNGFPPDSGKQGWLITVTDIKNTIHVLAFDDSTEELLYTLNYTGVDDSLEYLDYDPTKDFSTHWYEISSITLSSVKSLFFVQVGSMNNPSLDVLKLNGFLFVLSGGHD